MNADNNLAEPQRDEARAQTPPAARPAAQAPGKGRRDRWVKLGFLMVTLGGAGWVYYWQHSRTRLTDWQQDLPAALAAGAREKRPVVAIIYDSPNDYYYRQIQDVVEKDGNRKAMDKMHAIRVATRLTAEEAQKYGVTKYPTTLLFDANGQVAATRSGFIEEIEYRQRFLKGMKQER
jgi:hypothetical protein